MGHRQKEFSRRGFAIRRKGGGDGKEFTRNRDIGGGARERKKKTRETYVDPRGEKGKEAKRTQKKKKKNTKKKKGTPNDGGKGGGGGEKGLAKREVAGGKD